MKSTIKADQPLELSHTMKFTPAPLKDAFTIDIERHGDDRGFFARAFCERELSHQGLEPRFVQINNALSGQRGTLRGLHYQLAPAAEVKIMRCIRGAVWDVIIDLRPDSPTFGQSFGTELSALNRRMMYIPRGFAHAALSLADDTEILYLVSEFYAPAEERGIRWNDPHFAIEWPDPPIHISDKDRSWPDFDPAFHGIEKLRGIK